MEQWNSVGRTVWCNSGIVLVEQWNSVGGIVEQCWWHSGTVMLEQCWWNSDSGTIMRWNNKTVFVEQCGGTVEQCWCNSVVEQWNSGTMKVE